MSKNNSYRVRYKTKQIGTYNTLEESVKELDNYINIFKLNIVKEINSVPIIRNENEQAILILYNKNKEKIGETIVDDNIYYKLMEYKWSFNNNKVSGFVEDNKVYLHRYVMNYDGLDYVDHINNNSLDNRKCNLRIVTPKQNSMNKSSAKNSSSKYIGVTWCKRVNKWTSIIKVNDKNKHLGYFIHEIDAAKKRDEMTLFYFKEYGNLNFPNN